MDRIAATKLVRSELTRRVRILDEAREQLAAAEAYAVADASAALRIDEVWTSMRFAGSKLERGDVEALLRRDVATGGHKLEDYLRVADYAKALTYARELPLAGNGKRYIAIGEIIGLHARVARGSSERAGALRETSLRAFPGGMVATPAWQIPQALASFVQRFRIGPSEGGTATLLWVADAHARFERIQPFDVANGRTGRLLVNLLLRRCGYLPISVRPRDVPEYVAAMSAAYARDRQPLASFVARSLSRSYARVLAALPDVHDVRPLCEFATGRERAALYKAAQRGTLRAFRRNGRLYTNESWIQRYHSSTQPRERSA